MSPMDSRGWPKGRTVIEFGSVANATKHPEISEPMQEVQEDMFLFQHTSFEAKIAPRLPDANRHGTRWSAVP